MKIFTRQTIREFLHVLAIIFPLTIVIPNIMHPLIKGLALSETSLIAILLVDTVIVSLAVFILLPALNKLTSKLFA